MSEPKTTPLFLTYKVCKVKYWYPEHHGTVEYETSGAPPKGQCHVCLALLRFKVVPVYESDST
jgi:hypothetical protein